MSNYDPLDIRGQERAKTDKDVRDKLEMIPTISEADVELVFDPPWNRTMMSEAARLETGMF